MASTVLAADVDDDFFKAVANDNPNAVMSAMVRGADPNQRDAKGQVALYLALRDESWRAVDSLLQYRALDVNAANAVGETPVMMAALRGNLELVKKLAARGAKLDQPQPGWTTLHYAATAGEDSRCTEWLLSQGVNINARSPNGTTPLMMAARYGSEASMLALLKAGADKAARNDLGLTAVDFAREVGRDAFAARLK